MLSSPAAVADEPAHRGEGQPSPLPHEALPPGAIPVVSPPFGAGPAVQLLLPGIIQQQQLRVWQGQYPPPEAVERYEKVLPGAFNRMMKMAEEGQAAQIRVADKAVDALATDTARGHWLGFVTTLTAMGFAFGSAFIGQPWVAVAFLSVPVMAVAKALVESAKAPPMVAPQPQPPAPVPKQG